jgi:hypothetical protein
MMSPPANPPSDRDAYADRRAFPRVPVALPAFLEVNGERHAVQILDLSAGGAKLSSQADPPTGMTVLLDCGAVRRAATIRWRSPGVLGLAFEGELDAHEVSALVERSRALDARMKRN